MKKGFVYAKPEDNGVYPSELFSIDPETFQPDPDLFRVEKADGTSEICVSNWGLKIPEDVRHPLIAMLEQKSTERIYCFNSALGPLQQFVAVLGRRKKDAYKKYQEELENMDFILKISLAGCEEECWRRFQVPATISLASLHDQVLVPVMGWARGYHGYVFSEPKDGSIWGPKNNSGYIDMMHVGTHYHDIMDDVKIPLGTILRSVGDKWLYTYDLGDQFFHHICVEAIVSSNESGDPATLLAGYGACPPEDSNGLDGMGNFAYRAFLDLYKANPSSKQIKSALTEASHSVNYRKNWLTGQIRPFQPERFNIGLRCIGLCYKR